MAYENRLKLAKAIADIANDDYEVREDYTVVCSSVHVYTNEEYKRIVQLLRLLKRMSLSHSRELQTTIDELTEKVAGPVVIGPNGMYYGPQTSNTI
jgi:hypothetical protein